MDYLRGPNIIIRVLKGGRGGQEGWSDLLREGLNPSLQTLKTEGSHKLENAGSFQKLDESRSLQKEMQPR